ncbi:MAG: UDP-N-acetylglucosamine-1-phosphate transferase [Candidatus Thermoplasmatota archaeon]|nr:UDP-N-acetylglucosamine-1-phosphate transferase [Euryarchaeota archaeon]MBU4032867.1 UDP-N-acetylglucosamine-1-phosphate transferase [Candidatus Thermoplasmatota archaeon]MBU4071496.1 UDP-N-acetylglucosamine-1-phosphate transferase [Candidatus Thermoplasmatota archaeon]MBU4144090.1 UDP-N-acetylglucosamine-1-phosphate transferase [Candidatus Thermoplasmatota archaeon]MBU4590982.1 UDP-N-acetylglucosamine-1-phosphate transferase [Candidatus Thermoplasmatota archaeon]
MSFIPVAITLLFSMGLSILAAPWFIRKMREKGQVVTDYYKPNKPKVANNGGILTLFVVFTTIIVIPLVFRLLVKLNLDIDFPREFQPLDNALLMVVLLYAFYGVLDDYLDVGRFSKVILPLMFAYPLVIVMSGWSVWVPFLGELGMATPQIDFFGFGTITISMVLRYLIIPIYIMVVANLKNMHSGYNGLQSGTALIVLTFLLLKSVMDKNLGSMYTIAALIGSLAVFFWYNKYPSKMLEGNIGSLAVGAAIGAGFAIQHYLFAGVVMLIPHIINFLMYVYWRIMNKRLPDDPRYAIVKFGKLREDGTLEVPNRFTLKWLLPYHFRMTEVQVVYSMYLLTLVFCILGLFVPG